MAPIFIYKPSPCPAPCRPLWASTYPQPDAQDQHEVQNHHQDVFGTVDVDAHRIPVHGDDLVKVMALFLDRLFP